MATKFQVQKNHSSYEKSSQNKLLVEVMTALSPTDNPRLATKFLKGYKKLRQCL